MRRCARALAAMAVALVGASGCCTCVDLDYTYRSGAARAPAAAPPFSPLLRVLHVADIGEPNCQQRAVSDAMAAAHRRAPFDLAVAPGDNVYNCGPDATLPGAADCRFADDGNGVAAGYAAPADPSFARFEDAFAPLAGVPIHLALGNHDVATAGSCAVPGVEPATAARRKACLEVAHASPLWSMPGRHYAVDRGPARFIVVDTNLLGGDYAGFTFADEEAFVAAAAAGCDGRACFLVGHHPAVTAGSHHDDATPEYLARVDRLLAAGQGRIRAWLAGHDHDLQHLRTPGGVDVLVSGNGSRARGAERFRERSAPGAELLFAAVRWGFGVLEVGDGGWRYRFESDDGTALYCCAAAGTGRCEPVACR
ncbi:metallophosphoesterase [Anaeromyxobacter dehalogenans]|uniref:Calcineurin-like phosphoesterase domain-containing protein n=1 Tax=Anaeromyxobacter dehalogenans (strain 2CP-C) TaxID=290397 RepID=Q2IQE2_ANADE|nr:metallophosphoesterase [Anaeromyxobacter dehalogenans]ABC81020.1 hypothetical protein Adeh_1246 [Anaeromyxobacter dehalogenans 2CP-C]